MFHTSVLCSVPSGTFVPGGGTELTLDYRKSTFFVFNKSHLLCSPKKNIKWSKVLARKLRLILSNCS